MVGVMALSLSAVLAQVEVPPPTPVPLKDAYAVEEKDSPATCGSGEAQEFLAARESYLKAKKEESGRPVRLALFALIAAALKLLISASRLISPLLSSDKGKGIIRVATLSIGVLVFLFSRLAAQESFLDSLILAASGPFSVALHEYTKLFPRKKAADGEQEQQSGSDPG